MNRNLQQRMRAVLYQLKREYGGRIDLYKQGATTSDPKTGQRIVQKSVTVIPRAIILPAEIARREIRGISLISANKSLVQGGWYDNIGQVFIIDRRDCPGLKMGNEDWIVHDGKKYQIDKEESFEFEAGWVVKAKALLGEVPEQIHLLSADSLLSLGSAAGSE